LGTSRVMSLARRWNGERRRVEARKERIKGGRSRDLVEIHSPNRIGRRHRRSWCSGKDSCKKEKLILDNKQ
jgi:hypothetical protein